MALYETVGAGIATESNKATAVSAWSRAEFVAVVSVLRLICNLIALTCRMAGRGERQSLEIMNLSRACSPKIIGNITWRVLFYLSFFLSDSVKEKATVWP